MDLKDDYDNVSVKKEADLLKIKGGLILFTIIRVGWKVRFEDLIHIIEGNGEGRGDGLAGGGILIISIIV